MNPDPHEPPSPLAALLSAPDTARLLRRRARELARPPAPAAPQRLEPYVRFRLGRDEEYGIPHYVVDEVLTVERIARVPCAPPAFPGIINRRGQMLPVLDLGHLFGLESPAANHNGRIGIVIASAAGLTIGLSVREPIDIDSYPVDSLGPLPPVAGKLQPVYVIGLLHGRTTLLDMERIFSDLRFEERHA